MNLPLALGAVLSTMVMQDLYFAQMFARSLFALFPLNS